MPDARFSDPRREARGFGRLTESLRREFRSIQNRLARLRAIQDVHTKDIVDLKNGPTGRTERVATFNAFQHGVVNLANTAIAPGGDGWTSTPASSDIQRTYLGNAPSAASITTEPWFFLRRNVTVNMRSAGESRYDDGTLDFSSCRRDIRDGLIRRMYIYVCFGRRFAAYGNTFLWEEYGPSQDSCGILYVFDGLDRRPPPAFVGVNIHSEVAYLRQPDVDGSTHPELHLPSYFTLGVNQSSPMITLRSLNLTDDTDFPSMQFKDANGSSAWHNPYFQADLYVEYTR